MITRAIICTVLTGAWAFIGIAAQEPEQHAFPQSAEEFVRQYAAAEGSAFGMLWEAFRGGCPVDLPRLDSIVSQLVEVELTSFRAGETALLFGSVIGRCDDERIAGWMRSELLRASSPYELIPLLALMEARPTTENVEVVKRAAFNAELNDGTRSFILQELIRHVIGTDPRDRVDLLAEVYEASGRLPDPYHNNEVGWISLNDGMDYWRSRMLEALLKHPTHPGALALLQRLGSDAIYGLGADDPRWARQIGEAMVVLESNPELPQPMREGAARTRQLVEKRQR